MKVPAGVTIAPSADVHRSTRFILQPGAVVVIGPDVTIAEDVRFVVHARVEIGPGCAIAAGAAFVDHGPRFADVETPIREQGTTAQPIVVGASAAIGERAVLGPGAVVAPGGTVLPRALVGRAV